MTHLLGLVLALTPAAEPGGLLLLADQPWYKEAKQPEHLFEGTLERNPSSGRVGPAARFNAFRLTWIDGAGKPGGRELYLPDKAYLLAENLGQRIRLVGKAVDFEADGKTYQEIWPARWEQPNAPMTPATPLVVRDGILARCYWHPGGGLQREPKLFVYRAALPLITPLRLSGPGAESAASALMSQKLGVETIDWNKHMLVCITLGLNGRPLTILRTEVKDKVLTVYYRVGNEGAGIGVSAETVLVERFDGEVTMKMEPTQ